MNFLQNQIQLAIISDNKDFILVKSKRVFNEDAGSYYYGKFKK